MLRLPRWLERMPPGPDKERALQTFVLREAVLYAHPEATIQRLAELINVNYFTLCSQIQARCRPSDKTRDGIGRLLGPEFIARMDGGL